MTSASRHHRPRLPAWRTISAILLLCILACLPAAAAADPLLITADPLLIPVATPTFGDAAETIVRDNRTPMMRNGHWTYLEQEDLRELRQRDQSRAAGAVVTTALAGTATATTTPLPTPFDSSLGSNFTSNSCPTFINSFLTDATFKACYPFSLLLQGSRSFFQAEKSLVGITRVLEASCKANVTFCTNYLDALATNLTDTANCGQDYQKGNSVVVQAYQGMAAYRMLYAATCLKDPDSSMYCFANAVTNTSTPANVYFYYLPLNISLPGSSAPSCNWCLQQTMAVFHSAAANRKQAIANTYKSAAQQVNTICGPSFVNDTLPTSTSSGVSLRSGLLPSLLSPLILSLAAACWLL